MEDYKDLTRDTWVGNGSLDNLIIYCIIYLTNLLRAFFKYHL